MKKILRLAATLHTRLNDFASLLQSPLLFLIRIYWGWQFFLTGKGKLLNLERTVEFFSSIHIPLPKLNAIMAASTECIGGLFLAVGLMSRLTAIPLAFTMIVAFATTEQEALGKLFHQGDPEAVLKSDPFLFLFASLIVLAFGPGKIALDALLERWCGKKCAIEQAKPQI